MFTKDLTEQAFREKGVDIRIIISAGNFLREKFEANPKYSFNDPSIMINHSINVMNLAAQIAHVESEQSDLLVVALGALFHDIGKAADESPETLRAKHAQFNWDIAYAFLETLDLKPEQLEKLRNILFENPETFNSTIEQKIVKDADIIAFISEEALQKALYNWAEEQEPGGGKIEMQRKFDKAKKLQLTPAIDIVRKYQSQMQDRWNLQ